MDDDDDSNENGVRNIDSTSCFAIRSDKHDDAICDLLQTYDGITYFGLSSPPYPKRQLCDPTSPIYDPVSSPQYIVSLFCVLF